jgi:hypothetical protein
MWAHFDHVDGAKLASTLNDQSPAPINLLLYRTMDIHPHDPFFQVIPHTTGCLKSLFVRGMLESIQVTTSHLSHPVPLLEHLSMHVEERVTFSSSTTIYTLQWRSLLVMCCVWSSFAPSYRNMANLTSFTLTGAVSIGQLLSFCVTSKKPNSASKPQRLAFEVSDRYCRRTCLRAYALKVVVGLWSYSTICWSLSGRS